MSEENGKQLSPAYVAAAQAVVEAARHVDEVKKELEWIEEQQLEVFNKKRAAEKLLSEAITKLKEVS